MLELPTTIADIDKLIQNGVQENLHLDYKASGAMAQSKKDEIAKDVSAFANSDGGLIIYGIVENNNLPTSKDDGVDHSKCTREWVEQIINSLINPRIDGIRIQIIPRSQDKSIYAIQIPKSARAPHQSSDKKYYKRFNFQSVPMEDYEINDIRNRRHILPPLVTIDVENRHGIIYMSSRGVF